MATGRKGRPSRRGVVPAQKSPLPLILGIGGGALLLIIVLAVALGGRRPPAPKAAPKVTPAAPAKDRSIQDTGLIMFVCANSPRHEDKEIVLPSLCPACSKASSYLWDDELRNYRCFGCSKEYPRARIACPDCGQVPARTRLKHR